MQEFIQRQKEALISFATEHQLGSPETGSFCLSVWNESYFSGLALTPPPAGEDGTVFVFTSDFHADAGLEHGLYKVNIIHPEGGKAPVLQIQTPEGDAIPGFGISLAPSNEPDSPEPYLQFGNFMRIDKAGGGIAFIVNGKIKIGEKWQQFGLLASEPHHHHHH